MSRKERRREFEDGWAALLGDDDLEGVTELAKIAPYRVDGVGTPASGFPTLMLKAVAVQEQAAGVLARLGYSTRAATPDTGRLLRPAATFPARLIKSEAERRFSLHIAYAADHPDTRVAMDGYRDYASPDAIESAAWHFLTKGRQVGLFHEDGTEGAGECVESFVWRADPWVVKAVDGSEWTVNPGDWLIGIRWSPEAWALLKSGRVRGVSMQGYAERRRPSAESLARMRARRSGHG